MKKTWILPLAITTLLAAPAARGREEPENLLPAPQVAADAPLPDYAMHTIACVAGGKFIEVAGNSANNEKYDEERQVVQFSAAVANGVPNDWQKWHVIYRTTLNGTKYYHLRNAFSGKLLTAPAATSATGQLHQASALPGVADPQLWQIETTATSGAYRILNKGNGLAVTNAGASSADGNPVTQEAAGPADKQKWVFTPQAASSYRDDEVVRFFNRNDPAQGSVAFDEGISIPLTWGPNNGKVLWVTQDAWDGNSLRPNGKFSCNNFFSYGNSLLLQPSATNWDNAATPNVTIPNGANGRARQVCTIQPNNSFAWPGAGVEIGNHVYIHCGEGQGLNGLQQSLYDFTQGPGTQWAATRTTPAGMSGQTAINYAAGMVKAADGYVYAFGTRNTNFNYSSDVHVARFPVTNPQAWTFWNGSAWVGTPVTGAAARIGEALGTNSVAYLNGRYILMTMDQGFQCDNARSIYLATATSPTGPFTPRAKVYDIEEYLYGRYARYYTPALHPEAVNGRNELLLTYCLNYSACNVDPCVAGFLDPYFYRVKGIRVPYSLLGLPVLAPAAPVRVAAPDVFPNPAHTTTTLRLPAVAGATQATLTLTDGVGRVQQTRTVALPAAGPRPEIEVDVRGLPPGLYVLHVRVGAARTVRRLLVE